MTTTLNSEKVKSFIEEQFKTIVPTLEEYITIPNLSPAYDENVLTNGYQDQAIDLMVKWVKDQNVKDLQLDVVRAEGKTPLIFMEIPATKKDNVSTVMLYGHMDKQPPFTGWHEDLGPYKPVIKDGKLYGRGGADDGYAIFSSLSAVMALKEQNIPHDRYIVMIEASEESGSPDLPYYVNLLRDRIGSPKVVVCLDSGAGNYEQLWLTTSLRGIIVAELHVSLIHEGVHSGSGSGAVADSFRVARQLLSRLEDENTGKIIPSDFYVEIPQERLEQNEKCVGVLKEEIVQSFPLNSGVSPVTNDLAELNLNTTWRPQLTVTGADGLPALASAGNVLRPHTGLKLSLRVPPSLDVKKAAVALKNLLERDPPYGAKVEVKLCQSGSGWNAPREEAWLMEGVNRASETFFDGKPAVCMGEGGSIPFLGMLGELFPQAQFFITGVLGPQSNAHGPNEFLHLDFCKRLTCSVTSVLETISLAH